MPIDTRSIDRLAPTRVTVLIEGGTEDQRAAVAQQLHDRSPRCREPFAKVDCAGLTHDAIDRSFGAPASQRAPRVAGLGTLYVANVDAMPLWIQPRFLGFLDDAQRPRVVVAARLDLGAAARAGRFRRDLCERLLLVRLTLPNV